MTVTEEATDRVEAALKTLSNKFLESPFTLIFAAHIMNNCIKILVPLLVKEAKKAEAAGKVVIGTVEGDLDDIRKNLVIVLQRASGFEGGKIPKILLMSR